MPKKTVLKPKTASSSKGVKSKGVKLLKSDLEKVDSTLALAQKIREGGFVEGNTPQNLPVPLIVFLVEITVAAYQLYTETRFISVSGSKDVAKLRKAMNAKIGKIEDKGKINALDAIIMMRKAIHLEKKNHK